jgi:predicted XRE-type DNA-binding protein
MIDDEDVEVTNPWSVLIDDERTAELLLEATDLLIDIVDGLERQGYTEWQAAQVLGTTQANVRALFAGRVRDLYIDQLREFAQAQGLRERVEIEEPTIAASPLRERDDEDES